MAHLSKYTGDDLYMICDELSLPVSAPNKAAYHERLKGKFTPGMAKIFESYGGFEKKPGDAKKVELEAMCVKNGLKKTGNAVELMLRLAINGVAREPRSSVPDKDPDTHSSAPQPNLMDVSPLDLIDFESNDQFDDEEQSLQVGDMVRIVKAGDVRVGQIGKTVHIDLDLAGVHVKFSDNRVEGFKYSSFEAVAEATGYRSGNGGRDKPVGRLIGKRGLVYMEARFNQLYIKQRGKKLLLPMGVKWARFDDVEPKAKPQPKPKPLADKENVNLGGKAGVKKLALVVGVNKYKDCPLKNPVNDAKAISAKLKSMGYSVNLLTDCDCKKLIQAARSFTASLNHDVQCATFFFAGHGCEYENQNYLMTTTLCGDDRDLPRLAVSAHEIQREMEQSGCLFPVIILDCCRSFMGMSRSTRAPSKGMVKMEPAGSYLALACAPNMTAEDGTGANGTYTTALLKHMDKPDQDIDMLIRRVRADVEAETDGRQVPWSNHSLKILDGACLV